MELEDNRIQSRSLEKEIPGFFKLQISSHKYKHSLLKYHPKVGLLILLSDSSGRGEQSSGKEFPPARYYRTHFY